MTTYLRVTWLKSEPKSPAVVLHEVDAARNETRRVEIYADGSRGWLSADKAGGRAVGGAGLSEVTMPDLGQLQDLGSLLGYTVAQVTRATFNAAWVRAKAATT